MRCWRCRGKRASSAKACSIRKDEELFGPEAYRQIVASHDSLARHHLFKAQTSRDHAKARDGLQRPLFGEDDGVGGGGEA